MASRSLASLVVPLLAAGLGISPVASAQPTAADRETARGLMAEGRTHRDNGDLQGALRAFTSADAIMHVPTTGLEVARTQAALGLLTEARDTALAVTRIADRAGEPAPFKVARDAAGVLGSTLDARIPSLTLTVKSGARGPMGAVTLDDVAVSPGALGQPRPVDPGHHVVIVGVGPAAHMQEIDLAERDRKEVTIDLADARIAPAATMAATPTPGESAAAHRAAPLGAGASTALIFGGLGVAGAGVLAGSITGFLSLSKTAAIKASPGCAGTVCGPTEYGDIAGARSLATFSTVSFIAAGVGAVTAAIGLVTGQPWLQPGASRERSPTTGSTARAGPWLGAGGVGVRGTF